MKTQANEGPAPSIEADPHSAQQSAERLAAKQNVRGDITPDAGDGERSAAEAVIQAVDALPPAERQAVLAALIGAQTVARRAASITLKEAAFQANRSPATIANWARRFGIGRRVGGRYVIDRVSLEAFVAGVER